MNTSPPLLDSQTKKKRKRRVLGIVFVVIIIAVIIIIWSLQGTSQGIITQSVSVPDAQSVPSKEKIRLDGKYLSFSYLAAYSLAGNTSISTKDTAKQPENLLQSSFLVIYSAASSRKLAVSVERLSENNLASNTSFAFRTMNPKSYVRSEIDINGDQQATLFIKSDSLYEVALFMKHADKDVSIVLSSSSESVDAMHDEVIAIAKSVEWKN